MGDDDFPLWKTLIVTNAERMTMKWILVGIDRSPLARHDGNTSRTTRLDWHPYEMTEAGKKELTAKRAQLWGG